MLLLDAHSHLHPGFPLDAYLDGAQCSFDRIAVERRLSNWKGCLWIFDTAASNVRHRLERARVQTGEVGFSGWKLMPTDEPVSWIAEHEDGDRLLLILGRQLPTDDGFEVLQVGASDHAPDPLLNLESQVSRVRERGAYPVVPWGFGKWTFRRKNILLGCLAAWNPEEVALADSALRPRGLPAHPVLSTAQARSFSVLAGTDPLPFPSHAHRSGRYVAGLDIELSTNRPWFELRQALPYVTPKLVGQRDGLARTLWDQIRLRIRRR